MVDVVRGPLIMRTPRRPLVIQDTSQPGFFIEYLPMIRQTDWPNPVLARRVQQPDAPPNLLTTTLAPAIVVNPFKAESFFARPRARATIQPDLGPNLLGTTLKPVIVVNPFIAETFPNPTRRVPKIQQAHYVNELLFQPPTPPPLITTNKVFRFHRRLHGY